MVEASSRNAVVTGAAGGMPGRPSLRWTSRRMFGLRRWWFCP